MPDATQHEQSFARAFIVPSKRNRVASFLGDGKKRRKLLDSLYHFSDFDPRFVREIPSGEQFVGFILEELRRLGAGPTCYVISADRELDQTFNELESVLNRVVAHRPATIVSCVPGRLAYYEGESIRDRHILAR